MRSVADRRKRILDVALEVLGQDPDAAMGDIAAAAGVVRRTVYGHFPSRSDLVLALTRQAVDELAAVLTEVRSTDGTAEEVWVGFIARVWPLARRYRLLLVLRRSEYSNEIHALLEPVEKSLADLVRQGQDAGVFGRHLPAVVLSQLGFAAVFTLAESGLSGGTINARSATITSLLILGVPAERSQALADACTVDDVVVV